MYGPRPGDRVCKVNFSRLNDEEKRHTNLLLAKQDHEIVFEEQGGYYVANVKFVKSPSKSNLENFTHKSAGAPKSRSPERGASKSPPRDKGKVPAGRSARPTKPPVPTVGNHSRNGSLERSRDILHRDRSRSRKPEDEPTNTRKSRLTGTGGADSPPRENYIQQKLNSLKDYQHKFPKNDLGDSNYRPILIGKKFLVEKLEEIYSHTTDKLIRGHMHPSCADAVSDFLWTKYQKNTNYFHQALINILYSVSRLSTGNDDIIFFQRLLLEELNLNQFVGFLCLREIFQSVTKLTIMGRIEITEDHDKLRLDPTRILVASEVAQEMVSIFFQNNPDELEVIRGELGDFFAGKESLPYFSLMNYLVKLEVLVKTDQLNNLRSIFQPETMKEWDQDIGYPKDQTGAGRNRIRANPGTNYSTNKNQTSSPPSWRGAKQLDLNGDIDDAQENIPRISAYQTENPDYKLASEEKTNSPNKRLSGMSGPNQNEELSTNRLLNLKGTGGGQPQMSGMQYPDGLGGPQTSSGRTPYDTDLNLLLRKKMSALIGKFIDAIMDDDPKADGRTQSKLKMHAIVNRKCQNLLTSVFAGDRLKFQKLLMLRSESPKDLKAIDETYERYDGLRSEGIEQSSEKKSNDFLKGILKIDYLANQISNLIMYSTTPLEEIVRFR